MLRCGSVSSVLPDAYRAGCEVGEALADLRPELVLLFSSVDYGEDFGQLFEGLYDGLGTRDVRIFGGTGDGVCERDGVFEQGVAALALSTEGAVRWTIDLVQGVGADSFASANDCARRSLAAAGEAPCFAMVMADGSKADGAAIVQGIAQVLEGPFFGCLAGDDRRFRRGVVFFDGRAYDDAVGLLLGVGSLGVSLHGASGYAPTGRPGTVERVVGKTVLQISGRPAQQFVREQLGKSIGEVDLGVVPLALTDGPRFFLRSPTRIDAESGGITTNASIPMGSEVLVCPAASQDEVLRGVDEVLDFALRGAGAPKAAVVMSCAGRRWILDDRAGDEVARIYQRLGERIPLAGVPSFGEIGPIRQADGGYSPTHFHNVTIVVCFLGDADVPSPDVDC